MDIIEQSAGAVTIVEPRGRIDSVTARHLIYISSAGFRQLLIAGKSAGDVMRLFDIGAFEDLFLICASRENGIATARQ